MTKLPYRNEAFQSLSADEQCLALFLWLKANETSWNSAGGQNQRKAAGLDPEAERRFSDALTRAWAAVV